MEKSLSLSYDEAAALLEISVLSFGRAEEAVMVSILKKLGDLCREFSVDHDDVLRVPISKEFANV